MEWDGIPPFILLVLVGIDVPVLGDILAATGAIERFRAIVAGWMLIVTDAELLHGTRVHDLPFHEFWSGGVLPKLVIRLILLSSLSIAMNSTQGPAYTMPPTISPHSLLFTLFVILLPMRQIIFPPILFPACISLLL